MIKKKLFKTVKALTAATLIALGITAGSVVADNTLTQPTTAYAQSYIDSTGYVLQLDGDVWHCYNSNGEIDVNYDGIVQNEFGWWKVNNGEVDFGFNGIASNQFGTWYISNGCVDFSVNGLTYDVATDTWNYFIGGRLAEESDSVVEFNGGWWKLNKGKVDFNFTGLANNEYGWWTCVNGMVDFNYNGLATNEFGTWFVENGGVNFSCTDLIYNAETNEWIYINGGAVDFSNNSIVYFNGGWWKLANGKVDFNFNGIASNEVGEWYVNGGAVDFTYNGQFSYKNGDITVTCDIENGLVKNISRTIEKHVNWYDFDAVSYLGTHTITVEVDENGNMIGDYLYDKVITSMQFDVNGDYIADVRINDPVNGVIYDQGTWSTPSNLNLKDYGNEINLYWVKLYQ